jgi:hypothetical protein
MTNKILLFILLAFNSCGTQKQTSGNELAPLYNCWVDSREEMEDGSSKLIYRPCDYKDFAPSRYRQRLEFQENGHAAALKLAPNDAHYMVSGSWSYDKEQKTITVRDEPGNPILKYKVLSLSKDRMELEKVK